MQKSFFSLVPFSTFLFITWLLNNEIQISLTSECWTSLQLKLRGFLAYDPLHRDKSSW